MSEATKARKKKPKAPTAPAIPFRDRGLVGIEEVAVHIGVCAKTIRREVERGRFPACDRRIGRRILWLPATVIEAISGQGRR